MSKEEPIVSSVAWSVPCGGGGPCFNSEWEKGRLILEEHVNPLECDEGGAGCKAGGFLAWEPAAED